MFKWIVEINLLFITNELDLDTENFHFIYLSIPAITKPLVRGGNSDSHSSPNQAGTIVN